MRDAFGVVIFAVVIIAVIVAVISLMGRAALYDQIGRGGLSLNEDARPGAGPNRAPGSTDTGTRGERDEEIRQLLHARNERRARRGETALDVEAELHRLTAPSVDPALAEEVRQLVVARNERRLRAGRPALDVEAEVARQLRALSS